MTDLSGFWRIQFDPDNTGSWSAGFEGGDIIAVPASWNDQFNERRDYLGTAWYQTTFALPWGWRGQQIGVCRGAGAGSRSACASTRSIILPKSG